MTHELCAGERLTCCTAQFESVGLPRARTKSVDVCPRGDGAPRSRVPSGPRATNSAVRRVPRARRCSLGRDWSARKHSACGMIRYLERVLVRPLIVSAHFDLEMPCRDTFTRDGFVADADREGGCKSPRSGRYDPGLARREGVHRERNPARRRCCRDGTRDAYRRFACSEYTASNASGRRTINACISSASTVGSGERVMRNGSRSGRAQLDRAIAEHAEQMAVRNL